MKLITFSIVVNDWRDSSPDDDTIDAIQTDVRDEVKFWIGEIADRYRVTLVVKEE